MNVAMVILEFIKDVKGSKIGIFDFQLQFEGDRTKTFRNVSFFQKDDKHWFNFMKIKRGEVWVDVYEQSPKISKEMYKFILDEMMQYISPSAF